MKNKSEPRESWWSNTGGFFGSKYIEGDQSLEGYIPGRLESLEQRTKREVEGIVKMLDLKVNSRILDCPCGYGRHSIALAEMGMEVFGVDINDTHLKLAERESNRKFNPSGRAYWKSSMPVFMIGDMRNLPFVGEVNSVINMFYSFGFFETEEENEKVMKEFYKTLLPEGQLLLHTDVSPEIIDSGKYRFNETRTLENGKRLRISEAYDSNAKRINGSWTILSKSGRLSKLTPYSVRIYSMNELEELARKTGFIETRFYSSFNGDLFTKDSKELIMISKK